MVIKNDKIELLVLTSAMVQQILICNFVGDCKFLELAQRSVTRPFFA